MDNPVFTIDFETTDKDPKLAKPVEVALYNDEWQYETFIFCENIPVETSAIHHIIDRDVADAPNWDTVKANLAQSVGRTAPLAVLVAHNAEYEKTILGPDFVPVLWVCTYKCSLRVWPDAPAHRNEVLRYHLKLGDNRGRQNSQSAHNAMHDCKVTFLLFKELLKHTTLQQLIEWTEQPAKLPFIPMGKHYKQTWDTIPGPYLQWVVKQTEMREDVLWCAKEELARRRR